MSTEFDTSLIAWTAYQLMYARYFAEPHAIQNNKKRPYISKCFRFYGKMSEEIDFSGDTDFNFKRGFAHSRAAVYERLISYKKPVGESSIPPEDSVMYRNRLTICKALFYSAVNLSLMPQTGNLQSVKQGIGNDRIDTFIWALNEYYNRNTNLLLNYTSCQNMPALKSFLAVFEDARQYCAAIYHIDASLTDDLIASGKQAIDTAERVVGYMDLAHRFWQQKLAFFNGLKEQKNLPQDLEQEIRDIEKLLGLWCCTQKPEEFEKTLYVIWYAKRGSRSS